MCKISHITTMILIFILCVGCNDTTIDDQNEDKSENFYETTTVTNSNINETMTAANPNSDEIFEINLPAKTGFTPYVRPEIVAKDEFEHSEYMLMVRAADDVFTGEMIELYNYAFLGGNTENFEDGNEIYNKLDSIYSKEYPYTDLSDAYVAVPDEERAEAIKDHFFKRSIIFVSSDGKKVLCQSRLYGGMLTRTDFKDKIVERQAWDQLIEIFDDKKIEYEIMFKDDYSNQSAPFIYDFYSNCSVLDADGFIIDHNKIINYVDQTEKYANEEDGNILHISNATNKYLQRSGVRKEVSIHSLKDGDRLESIHIPDNLEISQFTNDERIVALFQLKIPYNEEIPEEFYTEENVYTNDTYIMNTDGSDAEYIGDYMFSPIISPDGKHVAYTGISGPDANDYPNEFNNLADMQDGFYIKNLETNQTIFYPVESVYEYNIVGWVRKEGLDQLLN